MSKPRPWALRHQQAVEVRRNRLRGDERLWSWARLCTFFGALSIWLPLRHTPLLACAGVAVLFVLFCGAIRRHRRCRAKRELADSLMVVLEETLRRCDGEVTLVRSFARPGDPGDAAALLQPVLDDGPTWALTDQERDDLDIHAAPVGLYGLLNRTSTILGSRRLRDLIDHTCLDVDRILARQDAVRWLDQHPELRLRLMAASVGLRGRDGVLDRLVATIRRVTPLPPSMHPKLLRLWGLASGVYAVVVFGFASVGRYEWGTLLVLLMCFNAFLLYRLRRPLNAALRPWGSLDPAIRGYLAVARQAAADLPDATDLAQLKKNFEGVVTPQVLPSLCNRIAWADSGGMVHTLLNVLVFWDLHVVEAILARVVPNREALLAGLSSLAELEALCSLGCFAWEQPVKCYPKPVREPVLSIVDGRHPLVAPDRIVGNDVELDNANRLWVVTGSNMSGKSTFLRVIGINVLLGQMGTAVTAGAMTWTPLRLMTDLRVGDDLSNNASYFLAEVRHILRMVNPPQGKAPCLGLIDEPFRGTNSEEQVAASLAVTEHLMASTGFFVIATHERRLTELVDGAGAGNSHFREELGGDGVVFDYRLRPGAAGTRNALRVLELAGYPSSLLARARMWLSEQGGSTKRFSDKEAESDS